MGSSYHQQQKLKTVEEDIYKDLKSSIRKHTHTRGQKTKTWKNTRSVYLEI